MKLGGPNEYRIVKKADAFIYPYEVQIRRWWFPIWLAAGMWSAKGSLGEAEAYAARHAAGDQLTKHLGFWSEQTTTTRTKETTSA